MRKLIHKLLGIDGYYDFMKKILVVEAEIKDLKLEIDDFKYELGNLEYTISELEMRVDELESIDFEELQYNLKSETDSLKEEVNEVLSNFESMTDGYTVSVKLNPPLI